MARNSKPSSSSAPAPAKVDTPVVAAPPAAESAPKKVAAKKSKTAEKVAVQVVDVAPSPVVPAPVVEASPAAAPVADVVPETPSSVAKLSEIDAKIQQINGIITSLRGDVKILNKAITREQKMASKSSKVKGQRKVSTTRKPSGFVKPTLISDELAKFLGKNAGTEMARTDVSKEINLYIRTNNLQDKLNGRKIHPDAKLSTLLYIKPTDEPLTYFNLQRFMKHHFVKTEPVATA